MKPRLKIGFVLDDGLDSTDGVQQYILTLGKWLTKKGHDVHYIVGQTSRDDIKNVHSLSRNIRVKFNRNIASTPLPAKTNDVKRFLNEHHFDVLHVQMPYSPFMAGKIIKHAKPDTAIVATFHILPYGIKEKLANKLLAFLTHKTMRRIDGVMSVSGAAAWYARGALGIHSEIVPNCIDYSPYSVKTVNNTNRRRQINVVYLGRLVPRKGVMCLLSAVARLPREDTHNLKIIIAGMGPMRRNLEEYADRSNIANIVEFRGFVKEDDKAGLLAAADIAVYPSLSGESFGIVLLEAMASGAVVLAGDNPGYRSVLGSIPDSLINPKKTDAFAERLSELIKNPGSRRSLRSKQSALGRQYDVEVVAPKILDFYKNAIKKNHSYIIN